jgi:nucleotide-binding universal stress UspA family protein
MNKILFATDGSTNSFKAAEKVSKLAGLLQAGITIISVTPNIPIATAPQEIYKQIEENTKNVLEEARSFMEKKGLKVDTLLYHGNPGSVICEVAAEGGYDLVVMGNSGLGSIEELFLGSVSNKVVHCAKTSVMIVK